MAEIREFRRKTMALCVLCLQQIDSNESKMADKYLVHPKCLYSFKVRFARDCRVQDIITALYRKWMSKTRSKQIHRIWDDVCPLCGRIVERLLQGNFQYVSGLLIHIACVNEWSDENGRMIGISDLVEVLVRHNIQEEV